MIRRIRLEACTRQLTMNSPRHLHLTSTLRYDTIEDTLLDLQLAHERDPQARLTIDLGELEHVERPAGALLSNLLVGTLDRAPVLLKLPRGRAASWLVASGLAFAVANRVGDTVINGPLEFEVADWRRPWSSGTRNTWRHLTEPTDSLFDPDALGETTLRPDLFGPNFAAFVDAHLAPAAGHTGHPLAGVVWPWLDRLLPGRRGRLAHRARGSYISEVGRLVSEAVGNVREHARRPDARLHSLVQLAVTRGGRGSSNRLHLVVQDNGPGIASTARAKVSPVARASLSDHQLLFKLCDGSLPPWGRGRGMGLPRIVQGCQRLDGRLRIWTKTSRVSATSEAVGLSAGDGAARIDGTVLSMTLPLLS